MILGLDEAVYIFLRLNKAACACMGQYLQRKEGNQQCKCLVEVKDVDRYLEKLT